VTAASKHGATLEIAEKIGQVIEQEGVSISVEAIDRIEDVVAYNAVVLGSAVYFGHWLEPARTFVERHAEALCARPTWLFSSGPVGDPPRPADDDAVKVDDLLAASGARGHRLFGGRIDKHRLGFAERAVLLAVRAQDGDYRDWDEIAAWAREIAQAVHAECGRSTP
jgi:menaquinone-dependent protoporphyrinogen oxidase